MDTSEVTNAVSLLMGKFRDNESLRITAARHEPHRRRKYRDEVA